MAYRDAETQVTALDHAAALQSAQRTATEIGLDSRMQFIADDYRVAALPADTYDLALAVDLLQLQPLEKCRIWLRQVQQSLLTGGELVLVGRFAGNPRGDLQRALNSLELPLRVPDAELHGPDDIQELLTSLDFSVSAPVVLDAPPYCVGVMIAKKK